MDAMSTLTDRTPPLGHHATSLRQDGVFLVLELRPIRQIPAFLPDINRHDLNVQPIHTVRRRRLASTAEDAILLITARILNGPQCFTRQFIRDGRIFMLIPVEDAELDQTPVGFEHCPDLLMPDAISLVRLESLEGVSPVPHLLRWHHSAFLVAIDVVRAVGSREAAVDRARAMVVVFAGVDCPIELWVWMIKAFGDVGDVWSCHGEADETDQEKGVIKQKEGDQ